MEDPLFLRYQRWDEVSCPITNMDMKYLRCRRMNNKIQSLYNWIHLKIKVQFQYKYI